MRTRNVLLAIVVAIIVTGFAQGQTAPKAAPQTAPKTAPQGAPKIDNAFVQQTFGKDFTFVSEVGGMVGDLDGDGVEDVVIAARSKNPLLDQAEHDYQVIDPYDTFFGYGDPKVTMTFVEDSPMKRGLVVLIIHGAGPEAWYSQTPKAKYVVINLPYRTLTVRKMKLKKKTFQAIYAEEGNELGETSAVFFDGKNYKYVPMGSSME
ncbi:MAG TPA: hypothetical protein VNW47_12485 [Terriglobales bacterium]|nr:hypothetical protein [Terriglobales bacterium]